MVQFNWDLLLKLTRDIPSDLDRSEGREEIPDDIRRQIVERDGSCKLCGTTKDLVIHHIIPSGPSTLDNLILLCRRCHYVVHMLLWLSGKWKYPYRL